MTVLFLLVFLGGALGTLCRHGFASYLAARLGPSYPWGTLAANVIGSLLIGIFVGMGKTEPLAPRWSALLVIGFCGGLTTFSALSLQTLGMFLERRPRTAVLYILISTVLGVLAVVGGIVTVESIRNHR